VPADIAEEQAILAPMTPASPLVALRQRVGAEAPLLAFPALWLVCVGLAQIHLLEIQQPWSRLVWLVVLVVPVAFVLGGLVGREVARRPGPRAAYRGDVDVPARRRIRLALLVCAVVGNLEEVHQFVVGRTIPLFSSHIDVARFALPGGPTIILTDLLTVAAVVALVLPRRLFAREAIPEIAIAVFALSGFAFAAGRGGIVQAIAVAAVARWTYRGRPSTQVIVAGAAVLLVFSIAIFYVRTSQHTEDSLGVELRRKVYPTLPSIIRPLVPVDLALATNMEALARIAEYFPANEPYGRGAYDLHGFDLFIPEAKDIQTVSAQLSPPWVTSTVAGPFWADGGLPLVVAGVALIGAVVAGTWAWASRTRDLRFVLVAANLFFLALFGVYVNLFTEQVDWILITPLLWVFGAVAERRNIVPPSIRTRLVPHRSPTRNAAS
jgi:hypothetical protein